MTLIYGRKWRRTKEPLDEGERGEWKSWLKIQHSKNEDHGIWSHNFMENAMLDESQAVIKISGRKINNLRYADDTTLMAESEEELKSFLMRVKEESEKAGLKLHIPKTKIMSSDPITSWQIDGETMETVTDFIFLGSKITVDGNCSHEIKRC